MTGPNLLSDVPRTARGHLGLLFYEAVGRLILYLRARAGAAGKPPAQVFETFPFLLAYWDELRRHFPGIDEAEDGLAPLLAGRRQWEEAGEGWLPLLALQAEASIHLRHLTCLVIAGLVEEDGQFGDLFAALQPPHAWRRPTIGLVQHLMRAEYASADAWDLCRPLLEGGLLTVASQDSPRVEWELRVPAPLWNAVRGETAREPVPGVEHHPPSAFPALSELILSREQASVLPQLAELLRSGRARTVVLRGMPGSPRLEIAGSLARSLSRGLLVMENTGGSADDMQHRLIGPLCPLTGSLPAFALELGPGEVCDARPPAGYEGPAFILMGREGGLSGPLAEHSITVALDPEPPAQRLLYWRRELPGHAAEDLAPIAESFTLSGGHIRRAAPLAAASAALNLRTRINAADVREAIRNLSRQCLDSLATRLAEGGDWSRLVLPPSTEKELRELERRCRHRERLAALLGGDLPGGLNRGVRALFEGPSGTGKTLAARVIAAELGLDLYRVDLASVVNKYIGETEKNLSRILSRAEDLDVVLLLDEGDSLMSRRTDVKSAHDRYANLETNYLLQRLETYTGIVIVTTNIGNAIDGAFRRRLDLTVKFHLPAPQERWHLWQVHLPAGHGVSASELERIAVRYEMTGSQIRNAAVQAALLAMGRSGDALSRADLMEAIQKEYRKAGAAVPAGEVRAAAGPDERLAGFLAAIS
jgi:hypothetical protein